MAVVVASRERTRVPQYPAGFSHATHACDGCRGLGGDCTAITGWVDREMVKLRDGRAVTVERGATQTEVEARVLLVFGSL